jgi:hypothetical protein
MFNPRNKKPRGLRCGRPGAKRKTGDLEVAMMRGEVSSEKSNDLNLIVLRKGKGLSPQFSILLTYLLSHFA